uniref:Mitochondrial transcription termination factor 4 n=1 Tax=Malurus cyaneus samueli TaxID=2593467 RepID=A0A8C5T957_9PASS
MILRRWGSALRASERPRLSAPGRLCFGPALPRTGSAPGRLCPGLILSRAGCAPTRQPARPEKPGRPRPVPPLGAPAVPGSRPLRAGGRSWPGHPGPTRGHGGRLRWRRREGAAGGSGAPRRPRAVSWPRLRGGGGAAPRASARSSPALLLQPRLDPERREAAAAQLLLLGLSAEAALALLERSRRCCGCPRSDSGSAPRSCGAWGWTEVGQRAGGRGGHRGLPADPLLAGRLQRAVSRCPQLFHVPRKRLEAAVRLLRERCLFTAEQLREVLGTCPAVLLEEPRTLHHQFQYAYFRMGVRQKEMVKARLFRMPFAELRNRHIFLERRGLYETPHKGQTQTSNPKLKDIVQLPVKDFLASLALSTPEEYEVFKKLLAREEEEEEKEEEDVDAQYTEEDDDLDR